MNKSLGEIFENLSGEITRGEVASYIPELKNANINDLALVLITREGKVFKFGEYEKKFTLQSISKILALALVLEDRPWEELQKYLNFKGIEDPFNTFYKLEGEDYLPANPMINAGAIVTTSLIKGDRIKKLLNLLERATGENLAYNEDVYKSESRTGDRNRAIAYILKNKGILKEDFQQVLESYFKQCSIEINCLSLAKLAYVFASGGYNLEGERLLDQELVRIINATMTIAGMYDYSGEFAIKVGLPSKSGVSGGIMSVVPGVAGLAVYSPGLDKYGNSLLGQKLLERISEEFNYSIF